MKAIGRLFCLSALLRYGRRHARAIH